MVGIEVMFDSTNYLFDPKLWCNIKASYNFTYTQKKKTKIINVQSIFIFLVELF